MNDNVELILVQSMVNGEHMELMENAARIAVGVLNHDRDLAITHHQLTVESSVLDRLPKAELVISKAATQAITRTALVKGKADPSIVDQEKPWF